MDRADFLGLPFHRLDRRNKAWAERNSPHTEAVLLEYFHLFVLICKLCCFVVLASCWQLALFVHHFLDSFVPMFDYSGSISLVWTTRGFYPYSKGFSTLKHWCSLMSFICFHCCRLFVVAPHRFLQVWGILFPLYILVCCHIYVLISQHYIYLNSRFIIWKFNFPLQKFEK